MSSLRHNGDPRTDAYLDAARACILDVGWRRTTLTEVARRAGVSRMTIYRAWSDMSELMRDLMTREWSAVATQASMAGPHAPEPTLSALIDGVLASIRALRRNELFVRIVELDPELILPYLLARRGRSQQLVLGLLVEQVRQGQAADEIRDGDPEVMARTVLLTCHGFVLSSQTLVEDTIREADLEAELATTLRRGLQP